MSISEQPCRLGLAVPAVDHQLATLYPVGATSHRVVQLEAWRTRVIYQTNLMTSYAAGRRAQLLDPELLKRRPF